MEKWIKSLSDKDIELILRQPHMWKKVPGELDNKTQDMIQQLSKKEERKNPRFSRNALIAFAGIFTLVVLVTIFFINIKYIFPQLYPETGKESNLLYITFFADDITITRGNEQKPLTIKDTLEQGDKIRTGDNSRCHIQLGNHSLIRLNEKTECIISSVQQKETKVELFNGEIFVHVEKLPHNSFMTIVANDTSITVLGTQFIVNHSSCGNTNSDGTTRVCVYQGTVQVEYPYNGEQKKEMITQGEGITISNNSIVKETTCSIPENNLQNFHITSVKDRDSLAQINLSITPGSVLLTIDNEEPVPVDKKAGISLEPGKHEIIVTKQGYIPHTLHVDLDHGEEYTAEITLKLLLEQELKEETGGKTPPAEKASIKNWKWKTSYTYTNKDNPEYNFILGFSSKENYAIAYTQTSLICINNKGMVVWEKVYGVNVNVLFQSLPLLLDKKVFVSSLNNQILVLNSETGEELERINTWGCLIYNYAMAEDQNLICIPFSDGLYTYSLHEKVLYSKPLLPFNSPTIPVFAKNNIIVSSFLSKEVACINKNGNHLWSFQRDDRGYSSPLVMNGHLFIGDKNGVVYSISPEGVFQKRVKVQGGITANLAGNNKNLFCLSDNGFLYEIESDDLVVKASFLIDHSPDVPLYIYKAPLVKENRAFIGTERGSIIIIDSIENTIEKELEVSPFPVSCTIHSFGDHYLIGTKNGEIIVLENN